MQDWPLEVADEGKLEPAIACYERAVGEEDRFDLMWFILFSFEMSLLSGRGAIDSPVLSWIEATMGRDFAVHGHTVRYWACLADVGFDGRCTIDAGWPVLTTLARRVFERSVVPLPISSV